MSWRRLARILGSPRRSSKSVVSFWVFWKVVRADSRVCWRRRRVLGLVRVVLAVRRLVLVMAALEERVSRF